MGNKLDRLGGYEEHSSSSNSPIDQSVDDIPMATTSHGYVGNNLQERKRTSASADSKKSKIRKLDTAKYVHDRLFKKSEDSDITVHALGRDWNLHKLYLQQCKYFKDILNENISNNTIHLNIFDENVTVEGLDAVLASLYLNEIEINLDKIEGILASAFMIGLDSIVSRCEEKMMDNMAPANIVRFHEAASVYGLINVSKLAIEQLNRMFWKFMQDRSLLYGISEKLLNRLLSSSDLLIADGEIDLYRMIKSWIFLHENSARGDILDLTDDEFQTQLHGFLQSLQPHRLFIKYASLFTPLRIHHLLTSTANIQMIEQDNLIPREIITSISVQQWRSLLRNEENPSLANELTEDNFSVNSLRLGKIIDSLPKCWRCSDFNFGIDILLNITNYSLTMKRNCISQSTPYMINFRPEKTIHYRVSIIDSIGGMIFDSYKNSVSLRPDQSIIITRLPDNMTLPISVHFQYISSDPPPPSFLLINEYINENQ